MDLGGVNWALMTIVGAAILAVVLAWAALRNRASRRNIAESERGARRVYEQEDREHRGESDNVV